MQELLEPHTQRGGRLITDRDQLALEEHARLWHLVTMISREAPTNAA